MRMDSYSTLFILFIFCCHSANAQNVSVDESNATSTNETKRSSEPENKINPVLIHPSEHYCSCDLKPYLCDINCCCDKLCSDDDRKVFSHCLTSASNTVHSKYCYSKSFLYSINAVHETVSISNSLFCVAWDNVAMKDEYATRETITSLSELKRITTGDKHSWFQPDVDSVLFKSSSHKHHRSSSELKSGDALRVLANPSESTRDVPIFTPWKLPHSFLIDGGICNSFQPITYLKNFKSKCAQAVSDLRKECTSNPYFSPRLYHENIVISKNKPAEVVIGSLHFTRHYLHENDDFESSPFENRYTMRSDQCLSGGCVTITVNGSYDMPQYVYDGQRKIGACFNAVTSVSYDISFNAKTGITEIIVSFQQSPIIQGQKFLQQTFTANFNQEINSSLLTEIESLIDRSGNPGYLFNKPILGTAFDESMNSSGYQTLVDPIQSMSDGTCKLPSSATSEVGFKVSSKSGCRINLNNFVGRSGSVCSELQSQIVETWKINDKIGHIGIFGNSNTSIASHWIPIITENSMAQISNPGQVPVLTLDGNCPSIITSVSYDFYFADIGLKAEPQSMILTTVKKYSEPIEIKMQSSNVTSQKLGSVSSPWIEVSFSVAFHDLTIPSRPSFAPPPTVKLQLPPDFFYPFFFSSRGQNLLSSNCNILLMLSMCIVSPYF